METVLLLVLLFITGCEARSEGRGCKKWAELICDPEANGIHQMSEITNHIRTSQKTFKVIIKDDDTIKTLGCRKGSTSSSHSHEEIFERGCPKPYHQTAYRTAETTITCDDNDKSRIKFFCKPKENFICEDLHITSSQKSEETFTLTETGSGFSLTIGNVSSHHAGLYWCGVKEEKNKYILSRTQLNVKASITNFTRSPAVGQKFSYFCGYAKKNKSTKFICKGEDPSTCQHIVSTTKPDMSKKFSMRDDKGKKNITITVREVTAADSGTYWCGEESTDDQHSSTFLHRMTLNVGISEMAIFLIMGAVLLMLLLMTAFIIFYKRFSLSNNREKREAEQQPREDYVYEELEENLRKPEPQNALTTIYATAKMPTGESDPLHYSTINFGNASTDEKAVVLEPNSSSCLYSIVKPNQS